MTINHDGSIRLPPAFGRRSAWTDLAPHERRVGALSPCLALLHTHTSYLDERLRRCEHFTVGNLNEHSLGELWQAKDCIALRERLLEFDFSPCSYCNSCDFAGSNQADCFGSPTPTCGGCLRAQGLIQCP